MSDDERARDDEEWARREEYENKKFEWQRIIESRLNFSLYSVQLQSEFAKIAISSSLLLNGGAAIAILAFVGDLPNKEAAADSLFFLSVAALLSVSTAGFAYFAQFFYTINIETEGRASHWAGDVFRLLGMGSFTVSLVLFFFGIQEARGLLDAPTPTPATVN